MKVRISFTVELDEDKLYPEPDFCGESPINDFCLLIVDSVVDMCESHELKAECVTAMVFDSDEVIAYADNVLPLS